MTTLPWEELRADLDHVESYSAERRAQCMARVVAVRESTPAQVQQLCNELLRRPAPRGHAQQALWEGILNQLVHCRPQRQGGPNRTPWEESAVRDIILLYKHLGQEFSARYQLLCLLSATRGAAELAALAELLVEDPPRDSTAAAVLLGPLFQHRDYNPADLFPRLLDAVSHLAVAANVLDLANFLTREEVVARHPASDRQEQLASLLGNLAQRLGHLEEQPDETHDSPRQLAEKISESLALAVSLCDALALIGDRAVVGKLYQVFELGHRRLRTEAAAALARLGEETGRTALVEMAAEPVARLRVIAYAEELGFEEQIDPRYRTAEARAEAELALWLAQPGQFGIPPTQIELVDHREQYWPGYEAPVESFLFRYRYRLGENELSNIGIAGPLTHAMQADLADLPAADIYAAFAGWQAEHEEIYEVEAQHFGKALQGEVARLARRLHDAGYDSIEAGAMGFFFGEKALVAAACRNGVPGHAVVDGHRIDWWARGRSRQPLGPHEAYMIYKGRKLLRAFNP